MGKRNDILLRDGGPTPLYEMALSIRTLSMKVPLDVYRDVDKRFEELLAWISFQDDA